MMKRKAYLLMFQDLGEDGLPEFRGLQICSENHRTITRIDRSIISTLAQAQGETFEEAIQNLKESVKQWPPMHWCLKHIKD